MRFESQTFWLSKDAALPDEYQDAFQLDSRRGRAAIADGVSSGIFSGCWARILVEAAVLEPPPIDDAASLEDWLARQRARWAGEIGTSQLTWFQRPKMVDGGMSTLLWIDLEPLSKDGDAASAGYRLRGWAIGDCCFFHLRDGQMLRAFPMTTADEFGLNPAVLGSINRKRDHLLEFQTINDECYAGDLIVLCTDAIALWAMKLYEAGEPVDWEAYWNMPDEAWREEIFARRESNAMRFDDSTLVLLRAVPETIEPIDADVAEPGLGVDGALKLDADVDSAAIARELAILADAAFAEAEAHDLDGRSTQEAEIGLNDQSATETESGASRPDTAGTTEVSEELEIDAQPEQQLSIQKAIGRLRGIFAARSKKISE